VCVNMHTVYVHYVKRGRPSPTSLCSVGLMASTRRMMTIKTAAMEIFGVWRTTCKCGMMCLMSTSSANLATPMTRITSLLGADTKLMQPETGTMKVTMEMGTITIKTSMMMKMQPSPATMMLDTPMSTKYELRFGSSFPYCVYTNLGLLLTFCFVLL
jgi:hypothetical protein